MWWICRGSAAFLAAACVATLAAQQPTFRSGVDLVQVDVVVVDKDGKPVRGLKQAAFTVRDRGTPQSIAAFEEIERDVAHEAPALPIVRAARLDVSSNQTSQTGRLVVMVIDDLHIWKGRTDGTKQIARVVLARLGPESAMAVLFTSGDHSTQVTADPALLASAIDTLKGRQSVRRPHPAIDTPMGPGQVGSETPGDVALKILSDKQDTKVQDFAENMTQYNTLRDAARLLGGGDQRRKAFVLISEGIGKDLSGIFGSMTPQGQAPEGGLEYAMTGNAAATIGGGLVPPYHEYALLDMMESLRRANVATYAIDPRGRVDSGDLSRECFPPPRATATDPCVGDPSGLIDWVSPVRQAQHGLEIMSAASGGFAVTNTNDFTSGLQRIVDDLDHYYLLGFYPSDSKGKGYRPIDVRIAGHSDWTLRYRHGYMPPGKPAAAKSSGDPLMDLSAGILPKADLPLRLSAIALPGAEGLARIVLAIEVSAPLSEIQDRDGKVRDTLKYEVLLVDEKKAKVRSIGGLEARVTLSPVKPGEPPPASVAYEVTHALEVKPGKFEFRVSALSNRLSKGGSVYLDLDVPDFHGAAIVIGGLDVGYAGGPRVPVAPTTVGGGRRTGPSAALSLPFAPSLDRAFTASDTLRVYTEARARVTGLIAGIDVVNDGGKVVASRSASFASGDPIRIASDVPLQGLASGAYLLRVTVAGAGQKATREIGFAVR